jgi:hypothetical protein
VLDVRNSRILRGGRVWADERRPERVEWAGNGVEEALMGEAYWDAASAGGSWDRLAARLGHAAVAPTQHA